MKPKEYVHLLYDDAAFSRSRFYFWAIGCLTAFDARILNNIKQFEQYYKAQVVSLLKCTSLSGYDAIVTFHEEFESNLSALKAIHDRFQDRLSTLESLRNGVSCSSRKKQMKPLTVLLSSLAQAALWKVDSQESLERTSDYLLTLASSSCLWPSVL
jgi:hypothetical protein